MLKARSAWQDLAKYGSCHRRANAHFRGGAFIEQFLRLGVPIGDKCAIQFTDDRARHARDEFDVMYAVPDIGAFVISVLYQILRAGKTDYPIYHNDLAVVTQVNAIPLIIKRLGRKHLVHRDSSRS